MSATGVARSDEHHHARELHDPAPNTYYGQWLGENARKHAAR